MLVKLPGNRPTCKSINPQAKNIPKAAAGYCHDCRSGSGNVFGQAAIKTLEIRAHCPQFSLLST